MYCPSCGIEVLHQYDLAHGTHVEYHCACGQHLQWDHPIKALTRVAFLIGGPQPCAHAARCTPEALFPCASPPTVEGHAGTEKEERGRAAGTNSAAETVVA
jgi:hypothetical protein